MAGSGGERDIRGTAWPRSLTAVRHGESVANAAVAAATAAGRLETGLVGPDSEIGLTELGVRQAVDVGRWLAALDAEDVPTVVYSSPFRRARLTAEIALRQLPEELRAARPILLDERLSDRNSGVLALLTPAAAQARYPAEVARRRQVGELRFCPRGGESLLDVAARLRAFLRDARRRHAPAAPAAFPEAGPEGSTRPEAGDRTGGPEPRDRPASRPHGGGEGRDVLVFAHDAVVLMLRCVLEGMSEADLLAVMAAGGVENGSLTRWEARDGRMELIFYNRVDHLTRRSP